MLAEMKQLFFFVVLLVILGIAGFFYRATLQAPTHNTNMASSTAVACQADAKLCPDGTAIGRSGPSCEFAACPFPNVELPAAGIAYVVPTAFKESASGKGTDPAVLASYQQAPIASTSTQPGSIIVRRYTIPAGKDANAVMLAQTTYETSGMQPKSMEAFTPVIIDGKTFQMIVVERFEGQVHALYYLPRGKDVLRFEATQYGVNDWTDPKLSVRALPAIAALEDMLATLKSNEPGS